MPEWGFTESMRRTRPYGLEEWLLRPGKVVTDPIHGDIFITKLEQLILDTPPMQRLRRVRQLGTTHFVYPGATHTRFAHSLGAVRVVQTLLDTAIEQRNGNHPAPDLFAEWEEEARREEDKEKKQRGVSHSIVKQESRLPLWRINFERKLAEATVLARLGALLHDVGHLPFGHTIEDDLRLLRPHDQGEARMTKIWTEVHQSCEQQVRKALERSKKKVTDRLIALEELAPTRPLYADLQALILSSRKDGQNNRIDPADQIDTYPFVADMVGNTICADLLDYLQRDHVSTGLPVSLGKRYLSSFYITPEAAGGIYRKRMALLTHRDGRERRDIVTEILKHLRYRYELQERVLVHHTKLAADAMVGKMFELWIEAKRTYYQAHPRRRAAAEKEIEAFDYYLEESEEADPVDRVAKWELEKLLLQYGDDGVLEHLADEEGGPGTATELAEMLLSRDLYKLAANALGPAGAEDLFEKFGGATARRDLEEEACRHADIQHNWHVVLWIPDPDMRLKLAELLVNNGEGIAKFKDKFRQGSDIYDAHKALWTISVFVHPEVATEQARSALARLGQILGVSWDKHTAALGRDPSVGPEHLAGYRALGRPMLDAELVKLVDGLKSEQTAARGRKGRTQKGLDRTARDLHRDWTGSSDEDQL